MSLSLPGGRMNAAARLITEVNHHLFEATPRETHGGPDVQVARRVHTRCLTRYQAIGLLLAFDQPDDGFALLRGLLGDSQRLQAMASRPMQRLGLALGWMDAAVSDLESRAMTAGAVGQTSFAAGIRSIVDVTRDAQRHVQRELGVAKFLRLPGEGKPLALATGHPEDHLDYVIASDPAHGALPTALWHDRGREGANGEPAGIVIGTNDPGWRNTVAERATRHIVRATWAMADVCGLPSAPDLRAYGDDIERRLDVEELPEADE